MHPVETIACDVSYEDVGKNRYFGALEQLFLFSVPAKPEQSFFLFVRQGKGSV